jgi:hypothetical protein
VFWYFRICPLDLLFERSHRINSDDAIHGADFDQGRHAGLFHQDGVGRLSRSLEGHLFLAVPKFLLQSRAVAGT